MINYACRYFRASRPCTFNKQDGSECPSCAHVSEYGARILFIKLDAIGDVLRSASLLPAVIARHPAPYIAWVTRKESVALVGMMKHVDEVIEWSDDGFARVLAGDWDWVYSLSNDLASASIASAAAKKSEPIGFAMRGGTIRPSNKAAEHWLEMAAFDRVKRANRQSYQERMLAILGFPERTEIPPPALTVNTGLRDAARARLQQLCGGAARRRIAVNVGSGARWPKKMLSAEEIYQYCRLLSDEADVDMLLVGGAAEADKTAAILAMCDAGERIYPALTTASIPEFVALLGEVDALLCGDTLALHIATAIGLPTVAVFGPTSSAEIHSFGGLITKAAARDLDCLVCYGDCAKEANCMSLIDLAGLVTLTFAQMQRPGPRTTHR